MMVEGFNLNIAMICQFEYIEIVLVFEEITRVLFEYIKALPGSKFFSFNDLVLSFGTWKPFYMSQ